MKIDRLCQLDLILGSQKRFLCNYRIPAQFGVKILQSVVLTSGLYGAEVWGGNKENKMDVEERFQFHSVNHRKQYHIHSIDSTRIRNVMSSIDWIAM